MKISGQQTSLRIPAPVSQFRLQNTRGAGAQKHADACSAVFAFRNRYRLRKTVLLQTKLRQTVVAAVIR